MSGYNTLDVTREGAVARVRMLPRASLPWGPEFDQKDYDQHVELWRAFAALRMDDEIRVVVLTGSGNEFHVPPAGIYASQAYHDHGNEARRRWLTFSSIVRLHETMAQMEKPIIARVNGNAAGFGSSLMFACDLIVALEDAKVGDPHLVDAANDDAATPGVVPGDGGAALVPLHLSPARANEYLMLGLELSCSELARSGVINYAVPPDRLDATVDDLVLRLLARPAYALAWTKRVANRSVVDRLARTLDAAAAYEMVDFLQWERSGWRQRLNLI